MTAWLPLVTSPLDKAAVRGITMRAGVVLH